MNIHDFQNKVTGSILGLECIAESQNYFQGNVVENSLGELKVCNIAAGKHSVVRRPHHSDREGLVLTSVVGGSCSLERKKDRFEFSNGESFFCRSKEFYVIETSEDIELKSLFVPYEKLGTSNSFLLDDYDDNFEPMIDSNLYNLMAPFMSLDTRKMNDKGILRNVENSLLSLITAALSNENESVVSNRTSYILREVINVVENNLTQEYLSPSYIADQLGYTQRYLNKLLKTKNMSLLKMIHQFRMEKIIEELLSEGSLETPIYAISGKYCFYDNSHFSRQFKLYTGMSPKEYRLQKYTRIYS